MESCVLLCLMAPAAAQIQEVAVVSSLAADCGTFDKALAQNLGLKHCIVRINGSTYLWVAGSDSPIPATGPQVAAHLKVLKLGPPSAVRCQPFVPRENACILAVPLQHCQCHDPHVEERHIAFQRPHEDQACRSPCKPSSDDSGLLVLAGQHPVWCPRKRDIQVCHGSIVSRAVGSDGFFPDGPSQPLMTSRGKNEAFILQPRRHPLRQPQLPEPPEEVSNAAHCNMENSNSPFRSGMSDTVPPHPAIHSKECVVEAIGSEAELPLQQQGVAREPAIHDPPTARPSQCTQTVEHAPFCRRHSVQGVQPANVTGLPSGDAWPPQLRSTAAQTSEPEQPLPVPTASTSRDTLACLISSLLHEMRQRPLPHPTTKPCTLPPTQLAHEGEVGACQPHTDSAFAENTPEKLRQTDRLVVTLKATLIEKGWQEEGRKRPRTAHHSVLTQMPLAARSQSLFSSGNAHSPGLRLDLAGAARQAPGHLCPPRAKHSPVSDPRDAPSHNEDQNKTVTQPLCPGNIATTSLPAALPARRKQRQVLEQPKQSDSSIVPRSSSHLDRSSDGPAEGQDAARPGTVADLTRKPAAARLTMPLQSMARSASLTDACTAGDPGLYLLHCGGAAKIEATKLGVGPEIESKGVERHHESCRSALGFRWVPAPGSSSCHWGRSSRAKPPDTTVTDTLNCKKLHPCIERAQPPLDDTAVRYISSPGKSGLGACRHHAVTTTATGWPDISGVLDNGAREGPARPAWPAVTSWLASWPSEVHSLFSSVSDLPTPCCYQYTRQTPIYMQLVLPLCELPSPSSFIGCFSPILCASLTRSCRQGPRGTVVSLK